MQALERLVKLQQKAKRREAGEVVSSDSEEVRGPRRRVGQSGRHCPSSRSDRRCSPGASSRACPRSRESGLLRADGAGTEAAPFSVEHANHPQEAEDDDEDKLQDKNAGDFQDVKRRVRTAGGGASITVRSRPSLPAPLRPHPSLPPASRPP